PAAAVEACLRSAGVDARDLDELSIVEAEGGRDDDDALARQAMGTVPGRSIDAVRADAIQAAAAPDPATAGPRGGTSPGSMASFVKHHEELRPHGPLPGGDRLIESARLVARRLGVGGTNASQAIDRLSIGGEPEFESDLSGVIAWKHGAGV